MAIPKLKFQIADLYQPILEDKNLPIVLSSLFSQVRTHWNEQIRDQRLIMNVENEESRDLLKKRSNKVKYLNEIEKIFIDGLKKTKK